MDFLSIQGLMGKLQAHEERVNKIQKDVSAQTFFFQNKMVLDIPKEEEEDLEEKVEAASIDQTIDWMKGTSQLVQLEITIWDPDLITGLTNQKLNAIIVKRQVIKLGIVRVQLRRLKRMQILW